MNPVGASGSIARAFLTSKLTPLLVLASLALGLMAAVATPREEEPQIIVPMIDILAAWPGASSADVERLVVAPLERAVREIPQVEYVYATSQPSGAMLVVRFFVNSDPERAIVNVRDKVANAAALFPPGVLPPAVISRAIDDVPILALTFASGAHDPMTLRRMAAEFEEEARRLPDVAATTLIGGLRRELRVEIDPDALAARGLPPVAVVTALSAAGLAVPSGSFGSPAGEIRVEAGEFLRSAAEVRDVVLSASGGRPVRVGDVARVSDGPEEPRAYVIHSQAGKPSRTAVTLSIAKTRGSNATEVAHRVLERLDEVRGRLLPDDVSVAVTRDYGETAAEKSNELILHLILATISVVALIAVALGWREAIVVAVAVPVTLALTLLVYYLFGYTLNRVTLFALIFSIGILVDDAIVVVENIHRHIAHSDSSPELASVLAVDEVGNPTILATFTVIAAILPMAFVSGLMGPYMRPIPVGASFAMLLSLLVAFIVSPWLALKLLRSRAGRAGHEPVEGRVVRAYRATMRPLLDRPAVRFSALAAVAALLLASMALLPLKLVKVKMLPFDNKSEVQIVVDAPEEMPLESTLAAARAMADRLTREPEVRDVQVYAGTSAPFNFNGLVRHYFLRRGPNVADLQVNLRSKDERDASSHAIALRFRPIVREIADAHGVRVKVAEIPPGPPVLSTLVAEVYGEDPAVRREIARRVLEVFDGTEGVVDTDWYVEEPQPEVRFVVDREKAAIAGVSPEQAAATLRLAVSGLAAGVIHGQEDREPIEVRVTLPRAERAEPGRLGSLRVVGAGGNAVPLSEISRVEHAATEPFRYRKNGRPVTYVTGEVAGGEESPVYALLAMKEAIAAIRTPAGYAVEERFVDDPARPGTDRLVWDGEWRITYEVFRDLGIAFAAVLVLIYVLVVAWFRSFVTPLVIMAPIPLTLVGILPGHAVAGIFFTATSMIGMIALAGIIVRNSILLVDFIELSMEKGVPLREAVLEAGAVRMRPIALTAAAVIVGGIVMVLDPIFQGLAVALMTGVFASTALTLVVIPVLYYVVVRRRRPEGEEA